MTSKKKPSLPSATEAARLLGVPRWHVAAVCDRIPGVARREGHAYRVDMDRLREAMAFRPKPVPPPLVPGVTSAEAARALGVPLSRVTAAALHVPGVARRVGPFFEIDLDRLRAALAAPSLARPRQPPNPNKRPPPRVPKARAGEARDGER